MPEPFGKRNRPAVTKPVLAKQRAHRRPEPPKKVDLKFYAYVVGGVLFLVLAGYAFAEPTTL